MSLVLTYFFHSQCLLQTKLTISEPFTLVVSGTRKTMNKMITTSQGRKKKKTDLFNLHTNNTEMVAVIAFCSGPNVIDIVLPICFVSGGNDTSNQPFGGVRKASIATYNFPTNSIGCGKSKYLNI